MASIIWGTQEKQGGKGGFCVTIMKTVCNGDECPPIKSPSYNILQGILNSSVKIKFYVLNCWRVLLIWSYNLY